LPDRNAKKEKIMVSNEKDSYPREPNPESVEGKLGLKEGSSLPVFVRNEGNEFLFEFWTSGANDKFVENEIGGDPILKNPELFVDISRICLAFGCIGLKIRIDEQSRAHLTTHFDVKGAAVDERNESIIPEIGEILDRYPDVQALIMHNVTYHKTP
jgi:hypothetical protein